MNNSDMIDAVFGEAVEAMDRGNIAAQQTLLEKHPYLIGQHLDIPKKGYLSQPYRLWFVADNPIQNETSPVNIVDITQLLIKGTEPV